MSLLQGHRERLNLTQDELAMKSGISTRTIQRLEAGAIPKGHTLNALSEALRVEKEALTKPLADKILTNPKLTKHINLSSLILIFLPLGSIIAPLLIMFWKKEVNYITKQIVSIQILWTSVSFALIVLSSYIKHGFSLSNQITRYTLFFSLAVNFYIILRNTAEIEKNNKLYIKLNFSVL